MQNTSMKLESLKDESAPVLVGLVVENESQCGQRMIDKY
jgi:hypothetical protein